MTGLALAPKQEHSLLPVSGSLFFDIAKFEHAQRVAQMLVTSTIVPEHFQKNIGNCIIALNLADRMQVDPFMLMQTMYVVHGKPGIEGKLAIALVNGSKKFTPLQYKKTGAEGSDARAYVAYATHQETGESCEGPEVSIKMAKDEGWYSKSGSKWKTMPELMLAYRSAMFFARVYCPEVLLGLRTTDELDDMVVNMQEAPNGTFVSPAEPTEPVTYTAEKIEETPVGATNQSQESGEGSINPASLVHVGEEDATDGMLRSEFIKLRTAGYSTWVFKNIKILKEAPQKIQDEAKEKWVGFYSEPWPLDSKPTDPPGVDDGFDSFVTEVNLAKEALGGETVNGVLKVFGNVENGEPVSVKLEDRDTVLAELQKQADLKSA